MRLIGLCIFLIIFPLQIFAQGLIYNPDKFLSFQIVQDQIVFDNSSVKSASIKQNSLGQFIGLVIELKPYAAENLKQMTQAGVSKMANIILNKKIVSTATIHSSLNAKFLITGLTRNDAQLFLNSLTKNKN